jgi:glucokinase
MGDMLIADIGGTNVRFAVYNNSSCRIENLQWFKMSEFSEFSHIITLYFNQFIDQAIQKAVFAVAGTIKNNHVDLTNINISINASSIKDKFGFSDVKLLNDFEAAAWGVLALKESDVEQINGNKAVPHGIKAILGAGTGLGEAIIIPLNNNGYRIISSEGGHCDLSAFNDMEYSLVEKIYKEFGHASMEHVLSGKGILRIFHHLCEKNNLHYEINDPSQITENAFLEKNDIFEDTMRFFCRIYGRETGNLALKSLSKGGVYIAGGIVNKIYPMLIKWGFLEGFLEKGRMKPLMQEIPVFVVKREDLGLLGCGAFSVNN